MSSPGASPPCRRPSSRSSGAGSPRRRARISLGQGVVLLRPAGRGGGGGAAVRRRADRSPLRARSRACPRWSRRSRRSSTRENRIVVRPRSRVLVTAGGNQAFMNAVLAMTDPGRRDHPAAAVLLQPRDGDRDGRRERGRGADDAATISWTSTALAAAMTPRTRAIVTVSPNNPTGAVYPEAALRAVNALCRERGIFHMHDEAYEYFIYGGVARSSRRDPCRTRPATRSRSTRCPRPTEWRAGGSATW